MVGPLNEAVKAWGVGPDTGTPPPFPVAPTAAAALTMPPVIVLPFRLASGVTVESTWSMTCLYVQFGCCCHTKANTPVTNGAACEVPE